MSIPLQGDVGDASPMTTNPSVYAFCPVSAHFWLSCGWTKPNTYTPRRDRTCSLRLPCNINLARWWPSAAAQPATTSGERPPSRGLDPRLPHSFGTIFHHTLAEAFHPLRVPRPKRGNPDVAGEAAAVPPPKPGASFGPPMWQNPRRMQHSGSRAALGSSSCAR
ncbi:hypothetical protein FKP32DRAFT_1148942 [Trametes sanguinea]|nr:hypothetical protein FKP32DRAFT_1148942 [Trametes sanguinea]